MPRLPPDDDDVIVWKLDELAAPFVNSSTSPSSVGAAANLTSVSGTVRTGILGLFGNCVSFPSFGNFPVGANSTHNYLETAGGSSQDVPSPITVSGWVHVRSYANLGDNFGYMVMKRYRNDTTWIEPFTTFDFTLWNSADGSYRNEVTVAGVRQTAILTNATEFPMPVSKWSHIGLTYDGTVLKAYLNGMLVGPVTVGTAGPLDNSSHGPWTIGSAPAGDANKQEAAFSACDWRVARVVRPLAYFKNVYRLGVLSW